MALPNSVEFVVTFFAIGSLFGVCAPLNPTYAQKEFVYYMKDLNVAFLVVGPSGNEEAEAAADKLEIPVIVVEEDGRPDKVFASLKTTTSAPPLPEQLEPGSPYGDEAVGGADDVCLLLHTSGTTSRPKTVPLTHRNLCTSAGNIGRCYRLTGIDTTLLVMPLFHVHGLVGALLSSFLAGACVVIPEGGKFRATTFWDDVAKQEVTWITAVPTIFQILLLVFQKQQPPPTEPPVAQHPKLRFLRSCSSALGAAQQTAVEAAFGVPCLEAYAMTEASHQISSNPLPEDGPRKSGTVGVAQNVEIAILGSKCEEMDRGEIGEVCIRGENVTTGYLENEAANALAFVGGWFHTGDQGMLDSDGYLTITGRLKELINRGGEKISPLEVDEVLLQHPAIAEVVTFGVPDSKYGEEVNAAVVCRTGFEPPTLDALREFCRGYLAEFKVPKAIFTTDELPKSDTGKLQRQKVAELFSSPV